MDSWPGANARLRTQVPVLGIAQLFLPRKASQRRPWLRSDS